MTPDWIARLREGSQALGAPLDEAQSVALGRFADLLVEWGARMDLTSIRAPDEIREKHFLDSLAGLPLLSSDGVLADLGSGAGFPGLVLAVVRPDLQVVSIESRSKKGVFQRQVARALGLRNVRVETARLEELVETMDPPAWITARALTDLHGLIEGTERWLRGGARLIAYKSTRIDEELDAARTPMEALGVSVERRLDLALPESGDPRTILRLAASVQGG